MENRIDEIARIIMETNFQLWQALLIVNGLLITALVTFISLRTISADWIKLSVWMLLSFLFVSSAIQVWNFVNFRAMYNIYYNKFYHDQIAEEETQSYIDLIDSKHKSIDFFEKFSLFLELGIAVSTLLVAGVLIS
jgi:hypothetical protein